MSSLDSLTKVGTGGKTGQGEAAGKVVVNKLAAKQQELEDARAAQTAAANTVSDLVEKATNLDHTDPQASAQASALRDMLTVATNALETANKATITREADVEAALNEVKAEKITLEDAKNVVTIAAGAGLLIDAWSADRPPTPQSAGDAYRELSNVAADTGVQADRQISDFAGKYGVNDLLGDNDIRTAFEQSGQSDFGAWLRSELASGSPAGQRINALTNPMAAEERERGDRIKEASQFYDTYDASKFRSPEQQAAMAYATGMAADPLDIQLGEYIGQELAGEYDPEWYRDIREGAFETLHPSMVAAGPGLQAAMFATDAAKRQRQQAGASMAHQTLGRRQAYAPSYASIANMGSPDPLAVTNVGKMGIGEIQPMDPTGPFFSSFPARDQDALMAAYDSQKSLGDKTTAFETAFDKIAGVYG